MNFARTREMRRRGGSPWSFITPAPEPHRTARLASFDNNNKNEPTRTLCVAEAVTESYETNILASRKNRFCGGTMPRLRSVRQGNERTHRGGSHRSVFARRADHHIQRPSNVRVLQSKEK